MKEIEPILADVERYKQAIQQAEAASKGLQTPDVFSRYERHITRQLHEALDRLSKTREQRNQGDFIGSFGQIGIQGMLAEKAEEGMQQAN